MPGRKAKGPYAGSLAAEGVTCERSSAGDESRRRAIVRGKTCKLERDGEAMQIVFGKSGFTRGRPGAQALCVKQGWVD
jgi:hypothetical protein